MATLVVALVAALSAPAGTGASTRPDSPAAAAKKAKERLTTQAKKRLRRGLARQLKRNPGLVLKRGFARQAALIDFKLPLTIRLTKPIAGGGFEPSDDVIEISYDDSVIPWPLDGQGGIPAQVQTTNLTGAFTMESSFSDDNSGYGELGAMETIIGGGIEMAATPFEISDFGVPCADPQLAVGGTIAVSSAGAKFGLMNMFSGATRGSLALRMTFASVRRGICGDPATLTPTVDNSAAPPMPVRFNGHFRVSPAITADGKMRMGVLEIDDAVTPQLSTFSYVRACTGTVTCDAMQFPARLKLKKLTADVLIGDHMP